MEEQQRFGGIYDDRSFWDKTWRNNEGDLVVWQWPNIWLIGWALANLLAVMAPTHNVSSIAWWVGFSSLMVWSIREITKGVNYFWRFIGVIVLLINVALAFHGGF